MSDIKRNFKDMAGLETDLILQAQQGNMNAFEQLVQKYDKRVLTIAAGYVNCADDAKDIYQEVFLRVYKGISKFQYKSEFSTWIFRITTNVCLSHRSKKQKYPHTSLEQPVSYEGGEAAPLKESIPGKQAADQQTFDSEIADRVEQALQTLSPRQKMVFTLKHYEGYKLKEIAGMMKCKEGTVKKYLFEAIARLRTHMKDFQV